MGTTYFVNFKVMDFSDVNGAVEAIKHWMKSDDVKDWFDEKDIDCIEHIEDVAKIILRDNSFHHLRIDMDNNDWVDYSNEFDGMYSYEGMLMAFGVKIMEFLNRGSCIECWPDNHHWKIYKNTKGEVKTRLFC